MQRATRNGMWQDSFPTRRAMPLSHALRALGNKGSLPLLWFGLFDSYEEIPAREVATLLPDALSGWVGKPAPQIDRAEYGAGFSRVADYIAAGDIYQANLSFRADVAVAGHPLALYAGLRARALAGYGGIVWTGDDWLLSLSPELFFALHDGKITTKPMKGTAARASTPAEDRSAIEKLSGDPKQRARKSYDRRSASQ
jgi:para-aminobenzoate synthetase/4-amino-4-deoxychorismate lyase